MSNILIAEDEIIIAKDIQDCLENIGHRAVGLVSSGEGAIREAKALKPDLVLMDIKLRGDIDGIEAASILRHELNIPIVYLTAFTDDETVKRAKVAEPYAYISKPFEERDIKTNIEIALYKHQAEQALQESNERFRILADYTYDWEYWTDPDAKLVYITPSCERITGYRAEDFHRDPELFRTIIHVADRALFDAHLTSHKAGAEPELMEFRIISRQLEQKWIEHICNPIYSDAKKYLGFRVSNRDITRRKTVELERQKLEQKFHQLKKIECLCEMAGGIAHDFNNILQGIIGNSSLAMMDLKQDVSFDDHKMTLVRENIEQIQIGAEKAAKLTAQMLAFSGKGGIVIRSLNLNDLVHDVLPILRSFLPNQILLEDDLRETPTVQADPSQIRQIITELVKNAQEAIKSEIGLITIRTGVRTCDREYLQDIVIEEEVTAGEYAFLDVIDNGEGFDEVMKSKIFDPFFSTKFTGRGLGLAVVLGIVRGHQGAIRVESSIQEGTLVRILLPQAKPIANQIQQPTAALSDWVSEGTILLADDDGAVRRVAKRILELHGFNVVTACDGVEAVEIFQEHRYDFKLVLLDFTMPRLNGNLALVKIKKIRPDIPVILSIGFAEGNLMEEFNESGPVDFIQKPYNSDELILKIKDVLSKQQRPTS